MPVKLDLSMYLKALPLYARNLGVALPPLLAAVVGILIGFISAPLTAPIGGAGAGLFGIVTQLVFGFAFGVALIFADDAWRHGRANLANAWAEARRKALNIVIATLGFYFLVSIAQTIGGAILGGIGSLLLGAIAIFFLIYAIPAAALGGAYATDAFSVSIRMARREPLPTAILAVVSLFVYVYVGQLLPALLGPSVGFGYYALELLFPAIAIGYVALVVAKQYIDFAFSRYF